MSKKLSGFVLVATIVLGGFILFDPDYKGEPKIPENPLIDASTEENRISYFSSHGWEVEEISAKDIIIPSEFTGEYESYASLQDKQGMPLREYAGKSGKLYVYEVHNYSPDNNTMLAELLVCDDTAIASLVYSEDGKTSHIAVS
ncbi:MAG: DUF4830 domain-containing protein [Ruminococcus sp.]|jgi:hypothetical protein|nr:DUF4830 domain-containing protein [Ruminococcus sp.]